MHIKSLISVGTAARRTQSNHSYAPTRYSTDSNIRNSGGGDQDKNIWERAACMSASSITAVGVGSGSTALEYYARTAPQPRRASECKRFSREPSVTSSGNIFRSSAHYKRDRRSTYTSGVGSRVSGSGYSESDCSNGTTANGVGGGNGNGNDGGTPRRFLSYAFVWTGPSMSGFICRVRECAIGALTVCSATSVMPSSPALRASIERDVCAATVRAPRECMTALMWIWKTETRSEFADALRRHVRHIGRFRAAVRGRARAEEALISGTAAFNLLELAENYDGGWWRRSDYNALRAIASREFDFRLEDYPHSSGASQPGGGAGSSGDNLARRSTAEERGNTISAAAMLLLLELQDAAGGPEGLGGSLSFLEKYVMDIYCAYALRTAACVHNGSASDAPWRSIGTKSCSPHVEDGLLDALGIGDDVPRGFRERLRPELRQSMSAARHRVDGTRPKRMMSDAERAIELYELMCTDRKHVVLLDCSGGSGAGGKSMDPLLLVARYVSWRRFDCYGAWSARSVRRELGIFTLLGVCKEALDAPRTAALGIDVTKADRRAARLWCSRDEVRVLKLGMARAISNAEQMRRYLNVTQLEVYVALTAAHAAWADAADVGYARMAWNGPIRLKHGLNAIRARQHLMFVPVSPDKVFSVLDWEIRRIQRKDGGCIKILRCEGNATTGSSVTTEYTESTESTTTTGQTTIAHKNMSETNAKPFIITRRDVYI